MRLARRSETGEEACGMRFRLGTLMLLVTVMALLCGLIVQGVHSSRREAALREELQAVRLAAARAQYDLVMERAHRDLQEFSRQRERFLRHLEEVQAARFGSQLPNWTPEEGDVVPDKPSDDGWL
jgi:hypothetical protein